MKKKSTTIILWIFSLHRFYLGKIGTGILYLLTFGGVGIWMIIDLISILRDTMTDANGNKLVKSSD
jgi:TM2 domain-containing membrane protein YozV